MSFAILNQLDLQRFFEKGFNGTFSFPSFAPAERYVYSTRKFGVFRSSGAVCDW